MRFGNGAGNSFIDFHSNTLGGTQPDSRIISQNGTTSAYGATLGIQSGTINMAGTTTANITAPTINITGKVDMITTSLITLSTTQAVAITGTTGVNILSGGDINLNAGSVNIKGNNNCYLRAGNGAAVSLIDFHSNATINDYDARIQCSSASSGIGTGILSYGARQHSFTGGIYANSGLCFGRGTFNSSSSTGMMFTAGGYVHPNNLGANNAVTVTIPFNMNFASGFAVYLTVYGYSTDAASMGVISSFQGTTATQFVANFYNARSVTAPGGTFGINYVAFGTS